MKRFAIASIGLLLAGCGSTPSPTSPSGASTSYNGQWSGMAMRQICESDGVQYDVCGISPFLPVTVTVTQTGDRVQGTIALNAIFIDVTGTVQNGELSLTGRGTGTNGAVTLNQWKTTDHNGAMTGRFTYVIVPAFSAQPITVTSLLDGVVKPGATPVPAPVPEPSFRLRAEPGSASRGTSGTGYFACFSMENYAPASASLTLTITPIGRDGRDYDVDQLQGPQMSIQMRNILLGCSGSARDRDPSRPVAMSYRLRVDYKYADGKTGFAEGIGPVTVR